MIKILDIYAGWLAFTIKRHYFCVSYLDDFKYEMNYLLGIGENNIYEDNAIIARAITLDGEGTELKLSITKHQYEDDFLLNWWIDDQRPITMIFDYKKFIKSYQEEMDKIKDIYKEKFLMEREEDE